MATTVDVLFYKSLLITVKSPDRVERKTRINIAVEVHVLVTPIHRKELVVRLTDDRDLFFLYALKLAEEDFQSLKSQQGLLIDFGAFPQKFIQLLELCLKEENQDVPKFILDLECAGSGGLGNCSSHLNVIETNPFKHLTHLSLKFLPGSDGDVKKYLADCLKNLKDQNSNLLMKLEHTDAELPQQLRQAREALSARTTELDSLKAEWSTKAKSMNVGHAQELTSEREKALQAQNCIQQRYERDRHEMEQSHSKVVKSLEARIYELETSNKDLMDRKYHSESSIRELKSKLSTLEDEHHRTKLDLQNLRKDNASLDADYHEQEKVVNQLKTRLAVSEQEVKDKEQVLAKFSDLLGTKQESKLNVKKKYEEEIEKKNRHLSKMEEAFKTMSGQLIKANEVIKKLQNEIKTYHGKLKLRNQVVQEQEKLLGEKNKELEGLKDENNDVKESLKQRGEENKKLNDQLETAMQKLEESRQLLKTNKNVINWLNKQVTESQLTHKKLGTRGPFELNSIGASGGPAIHNFSAPSYGVPSCLSTSASSYNTSGHSLGYPGVTTGRLGVAGHQGVTAGVIGMNPAQNGQAHKIGPQVHFNPGLSRMSASPVPNKSPIGGSIPEESDPRASPNLAPPKPPGNNGTGDPFLDTKYLQTSSDSTRPNRAASPDQQSLHFTEPSQTQPQSRPVQSVRMSKDVIIPRSIPTTKASVPPLASAYFPNS